MVSYSESSSDLIKIDWWCSGGVYTIMDFVEFGKPTIG